MRRNPRHISRCETHPNYPWDMEIRRTSEGFEAFIDGKSAGYIVLDIDDETEDGLAPGQGSRLSTKGHDVVSLDFSRVGLAKAEALAAEKGVSIETRCVDLADWADEPAPEPPWDAVVMIFVHLPAELRRRVARAATAQCAPGAMLVLEAYTPAQLMLGTGGPKDPELLVTRGAVQEDWVGWHLDVRLVERRIFEGMAHQGLGSVVQALGKL